MTIWVDAQLSPAVAAWISREFEALQAKPVRALQIYMWDLGRRPPAAIR